MAVDEGAIASHTSLSDIFSDAPADNASEPTEIKKDDSKPEGDAKDSSDSSLKQQDKVVEGESKQTDKSKEKTPPKDDKKTDKSDDKSKEEKDEKKSADPFESDENPYKKRFSDTSANWNKEHQARLQLEQQVRQLTEQLTVQKKIADGTYDPEKDDPQKQTRPEDIATTAMQAGKTIASQIAAIDKFGKEKVETDLARFHELFNGNEMVQNLVLASESPVFEALRVLSRYDFEQQHGSDPTAIYESIKTKVLAEAKAELRKEITAEIMAGFDKKNSTPTALRGGSSGVEKGSNSEGTGLTPLDSIFS